VISAVATTGVIIRPFSWPEAIWAVLGGAARAPSDRPRRGLDGRSEGNGRLSFSARHDAACRDGSARGPVRLARSAGDESLGRLATALVSSHLRCRHDRDHISFEDATAVVLTPAVAAAVKISKVKNPLPYLFICALIANAASFVLPISSPANLVIYSVHMPPLLQWLPRFAIPSVLSILATYLVLWLTQRRALSEETLAEDVEPPKLSGNGKLAAARIALTAVTLLASSGLGLQLGLPTAICGVVTAIAVLILKRSGPWEVLDGISWGVLPIVAGLFVLVEALDKTGLIRALGNMLRSAAEQSETQTAWGAGVLNAFACNLMNNLPAGLIVGSAAQVANAPDRVTSAILVGIDLGPNLSVTGSFATILWLSALRREGLEVGAWSFLKLGVLVMPPALALALGGLFIF
jgi:arsenical pump membrane protein